MNKLLLALSVSLIGQIIAWFHMQGQFRWEWAKSFWWIVLGGIPISFAFYYSTRWYYEYFNYNDLVTFRRSTQYKNSYMYSIIHSYYFNSIK